MSELYIRPEAHEIDTIACRLVPVALPSAWVDRELTGTDYGIDRMVEIFEAGVPRGLVLLLQIKGTTKVVDGGIDRIAFDIPVSTLKYALLFSSPFLLVVCPINNESPLFYYLWLQEYIRVVLDHTNPNWRANKNTVRVRIPATNRMPGTEAKLLFIAKHSNRLYDSNQAWWRLNEVRNVLDNLREDSWLANLEASHQELMFVANIQRIQRLLQTVADLPTIFGDASWSWALEVRKRLIEPAIDACRQLLDTTTSTDERAALLENLAYCISRTLGSLNEMNNDAVQRIKLDVHGISNF